MISSGLFTEYDTKDEILPFALPAFWHSVCWIERAKYLAGKFIEKVLLSPLLTFDPYYQ